MTLQSFSIVNILVQTSTVCTSVAYYFFLGGAMVQLSLFDFFDLTVNFKKKFCTVFVSFVLQLNHRIRVPRLLSIVSVFSAC